MPHGTTFSHADADPGHAVHVEPQVSLKSSLLHGSGKYLRFVCNRDLKNNPQFFNLRSATIVCA